MSRRSTGFITLTALVLATCATDDPLGPPDGRLGALRVERIAAVGDGYLAGVTDGALFRSAQEVSIPALFARAVGRTDAFTQPLVGDPGFAVGAEEGGRLTLVGTRPLALERVLQRRAGGVRLGLRVEPSARDRVGRQVAHDDGRRDGAAGYDDGVAEIGGKSGFGENLREIGKVREVGHREGSVVDLAGALEGRKHHHEDRVQHHDRVADEDDLQQQRLQRRQRRMARAPGGRRGGAHSSTSRRRR